MMYNVCALFEFFWILANNFFKRLSRFNREGGLYSIFPLPFTWKMVRKKKKLGCIKHAGQDIHVKHLVFSLTRDIYLAQKNDNIHFVSQCGTDSQ